MKKSNFQGHISNQNITESIHHSIFMMLSIITACRALDYCQFSSCLYSKHAYHFTFRQIDSKKLLQETHDTNAIPTSNRAMSMKNVSSVASNIMSKYGWKEGQGECFHFLHIISNFNLSYFPLFKLTIGVKFLLAFC